MQRVSKSAISQKHITWLVLHALLGAVLSTFSGLGTWWGAAAFFWFFFQTLRTCNRTGMAHLGAAYIVGLEVLLRMSKAALFWEYGKLACIVLLLTGIVVEKRKNYYWQYLLMFVLLVPGMLLATNLSMLRWQQMVTSQLGGPILLALSCLYFGGRIVSVPHFQKILRAILYPIAAILVYLFLSSPSLSEVQFSLSSNFATSGGFGPNQVSTALGLGMAVLFINYLLKYPPLFIGWLDKVLFGLLLFRALLTFSRGGVLAAVICILFGYFVYTYAASVKKALRLAGRLLIGIIIVFALFTITDDLTGNLLSKRFKGEQEGVQKFDLNKATSNRLEIIESDLLIWLDHPLLGVGIGNAANMRSNYGVSNIIAHTEQTRLLADHGLPGLIFLLWIIFLIWKRSFDGPATSRLIGSTFMMLVFLTMLHSATRLAMVGFIFGLGLIQLYENHSLHRQPPLPRRGLSQRRREHGAPLPA